MAGAALILRDDGSFEATPESKERLQLRPGSRLELVQQDEKKLKFRAPASAREIRSWLDLDGYLSDSNSDPNQELELERLEEIKQDARTA